MILSIVFSVASLILCGFFFIYFQARLRKKTSPQDILEDYRDEVNKLIIEIDAATERDAYLVEERIKSLKGLLGEIDKKMGVYVREFERRRSTEGLYNALGRNPKSPVPPAADLVPAGEVPPPEPVPPGEQKAAEGPIREPETRALKEQVAGLAAQGFSAAAIAARLKVSISEVELIIAIHNTARTG
jgi:hypothetical protein